MFYNSFAKDALLSQSNSAKNQESSFVYLGDHLGGLSFRLPYLTGVLINNYPLDATKYYLSLSIKGLFQQTP